MTPPQFAVTNWSMLGRIYLQQGQKQMVRAPHRAVSPHHADATCPSAPKAKQWLERALDEGLVSSARLDPTARENRAAAKKALASCR